MTVPYDNTIHNRAKQSNDEFKLLLFVDTHTKWMRRTIKKPYSYALELIRMGEVSESNSLIFDDMGGF